uniref:Pds1 n=1 Tax=Arundo donax TaxID=35708 RepID=A0A0A9DAP4_ARUDO
MVPKWHSWMEIHLKDYACLLLITFGQGVVRSA